MKRYLLFKAILTLLFIFPQETLAFSPDDTLVCGGRAYAISAPLTYGLDNRETSILFYNPDDTILIRIYGRVEEMQDRPKVSVPILTESPFFALLNSDEELKDMVRTCIPEKKRKEWFEKHIRIEIAVLIDEKCHCAEVVQAVEAPLPFDFNKEDWLALAQLTGAIQQQVSYDDNGVLHKAGMLYGTSRFIIDFRDGDVGIVMRPPAVGAPRDVMK